MSEDEGAPAGEDVTPEVAAARERVIEAMERATDLYGINRSYGRLYGILFFAEEPRSLDDLVDASGYAKSTVSTGMRTLERLHLVKRRSLPGEGKRAYYEAQRDFWEVARQLLEQEVSREITIMTDALTDAEEQLAAADTERARRDLEKVRSFRQAYEQGERLVSLIARLPVDRVIAALRRFTSE